MLTRRCALCRQRGDHARTIRTATSQGGVVLGRDGHRGRQRLPAMTGRRRRHGHGWRGCPRPVDRADGDQFLVHRRWWTMLRPRRRLAGGLSRACSMPLLLRSRRPRRVVGAAVGRSTWSAVDGVQATKACAVDQAVSLQGEGWLRVSASRSRRQSANVFRRRPARLVQCRRTRPRIILGSKPRSPW